MQKIFNFNSRTVKTKVLTGYNHKIPNRARIFHSVSSDLHPFFLSNSNKQKTQTNL